MNTKLSTYLSAWQGWCCICCWEDCHVKALREGCQQTNLQRGPTCRDGSIRTLPRHKAVGGNGCKRSIKLQVGWILRKFAYVVPFHVWPSIRASSLFISISRADYGTEIPLAYLADRVSMYMHAYTLYSAVRPFGATVMFGSYTGTKNHNTNVSCQINIRGFKARASPKNCLFLRS